MMLDDQFSRMIRKREIEPAAALEMLRNNEVRVFRDPHAGPGAKWEDVEDGAAGTSDIQHSLIAVGAEDLADQFSAEVKRLREEDFTVEAL